MATEYQPKSEDLSQFGFGEENSELHGVKSISVYSPSVPEEEVQVSRSDILDFGDQGFLLHHVLTTEECQHYIQQGETLGFEGIEGVKKSVRNSDR